MRKNLFRGLLVLIYLLMGCNSNHSIDVSVEDKTPQRTEISLEPQKTVITLASVSSKDMTREQLRVVSWLYLQQTIHDDYLVKLNHQQQIEKQEYSFYAWIGFFVCLIIGILGGLFLYLNYRLRLKIEVNYNDRT